MKKRYVAAVVAGLATVAYALGLVDANTWLEIVTRLQEPSPLPQ